MCTYHTEHVPVSGSAKGAPQWTDVDRATVYVDHPYHSTAAHTLNIDLLATDGDAGSRIAVELSLDSARELAAGIQRALRAAESLVSPAR